MTKMNNRREKIIASCAIAGILLLLAAAGCTGQQGSSMPDNGTGPMIVAVTILPQKQFVERIAGDQARVIVLVPPGASPHTYEPTARQLEEIGSASVYIKVGSGVDFERAWLDKLAGVNPRMTIVNSSTGIRFISGSNEEEDHSSGHAGEGGTDPHIWLSPKNARIMVENTFQGLALADPAHKDEFRANADAYQRELDTLDAEIREKVARTRVRSFMVYHPAWSYFARDYDLVQIPIETDAKDPSPAALEKLIQTAKDRNITVIFAEPELSTKSAKVIAEEIGGSVVLVSALEEDYTANIRNVSGAFARGGSP